MANNLQIASAAYIVMHLLTKKKQSSIKKRRWWTTQIFRSRQLYNGTSMIRDLNFHTDSGQFENFARMSQEDFEHLVSLLTPIIAKQTTHFREPIPVNERLAVTLRFLATGESYTSLQYVFKISKQCISLIVPEVCQSLIEVLKEYVKVIINTFINNSK
ncbi:unnamed protein product [Macrosiphum euphorbiae]|uniref:Protein ANTAGONIST OF LIKE HETEROCHROMATIN PROTEIN 1-like n=1 Tax=Macrosiphum euphorbiae TaxID=13131 RepID=A0AAV0Y499_9HEMI|nr:unnamed protein product [Macrosiphum euphorbiae]